jgi:hypothetical protein
MAGLLKMNGFQYINTFGSVRSGFTSLPGWGRSLVLLAAVPGIVLLALSVLMIAVSIIALLLLTVPVYRFLQLVCFSRPIEQDVTVTTLQDVASPGRRQIDAKVIE